MHQQDGPRELGRILDGMMGRRGLAGEHRRLQAVRAAWVAAAGEDLAHHTRVRSLRRGVLWIEVDSAPLCHRIAAFERDRLLQDLQEAAEGVHVAELRFRLGELA